MTIQTDLHVRDVMSTNLITLVPEMTCDQAAQVLALNKITGAPVVDERGVLVGVISLFDLLDADAEFPYPQDFYSQVSYDPEVMQDIDSRNFQHLITKGFVADYMSRDLITALPDEPIQALADRMFQNQIHRIVVLKPGQQIPVGIVSTFDLIKCLRLI